MKKNKITILVLFIALVMTFVGCTATRPRTPMNPNTQNRIGRQNPNDDFTRRRNLNMMGVDRRDSNDMINRDNNATDNMVKRDTGIGPRTKTDLSGRDRVDSNTLWHRGNLIAKKVNSLKEVKNSSILLSGNTAIVGVEIDNNIQGNLTNDLKNRITNAVKDADGSIKNVSVTANPDLFTRISNIEKDIRDGRPMSGFAEEFKEIIRRINPVR